MELTTIDHTRRSGDRTARGIPTSGLAAVLGEFDTEQFLHSHWEQAPLHISRRDPDFYSSILSASDTVGIANLAIGLSAAMSSYPLVETITDEISADRDRARNSRELWGAYERGATILVQMAQRFHSPLARLCATLEADLRAPIDATLICSPQGYHTDHHYDRLSGIVMQISGRKHWTFYESVKPSPLFGLPSLPFETSTDSLLRLGRLKISNAHEPALPCVVVLEPGDMLYVPRGVFHKVAAENDNSAHITLAVRPVTYHDLLLAALARHAATDQEVRKWIPSPLQGRDHEGIAVALRGIATRLLADLDVDGALSDIDAAFHSTSNLDKGK